MCGGPGLRPATQNWPHGQRIPWTEPEAIEAFFKLYKALYVKHNLEDKPHLVYSCDETGFGDKPRSREKAENKIEILCLPAHTTHILQPHDIAVFNPLKATFSTMAFSPLWGRSSFQHSSNTFTPLLPLLKTSRLGSARLASFLCPGLLWTQPRVVPKNYLVAAAVIPESLANVLMSPALERKEKKKKLRRKKRKKIRESGRKRWQRRRRKKRQAQEAKKQKKLTNVTPPPTEDDAEHCALCRRVVPPGSGNDAIDEWVQCDLCHLWFHLECAEVEEVPDTEWLCHKCCLST
ncbi:Lysine-specific demethylase 5B-B [Labeo rohita]|uniref:Lysine-specific demethylase 5B-B n=1 Tax=Labeo rohita TaxID=84645 RepID=A0ABQ8KZH3_LABRO|nr:Lysine-specific demethylase 5B-B [Labeo rohita]